MPLLRSKTFELILKEIELRRFRSFEKATFFFTPGINCITGLNGSGKTNLLNAIYYLCLGKGFSSNQDLVSVKDGGDFFRIKALLSEFENEVNLVCTFSNITKKELSVDSKPYERLSDHIGFLPAVVVCPDDQQMIDGASEERRRYLDLTVSQTHAVYMQHLMNYNRTLIQRNALLKQLNEKHQTVSEVLDALDKKLADDGNLVFKFRKQSIEQLTPLINAFYNQLCEGKEEISIQYQSTLNQNDFAVLLGHSHSKDIQLQRTTVGTHRDDLEFLINGLVVKKFASQGQKKTLLLSLKLAQYSFIQNHLSKNPLLLLDDIFDKLDEERMHRLLDIISTKNFEQVFITDTGRLRWKASANEEMPVHFIQIEKSES